MVKKVVRKLFNSFGLEINRRHSSPSDYFRNELMLQGLERCKRRGTQATTLIDVGAASGSWSQSAAEFWPGGNYLLFEPLKEREAELQNLAAKHPNFHFIAAAAGKEKGQITFNVTDDLDGSLVAEGYSAATNVRMVDVVSIQDEIKNRNLLGPYIIKLDTHGYEVPILEGCATLMSQASLFIIECYGFHITNQSLLFWEMCRYMDEKGFRLIDIVDAFRRPKDQAFWQCDAFFVPKNLSLFNDNNYR